MLAYTLDTLLLTQRCVIERDVAERDEFGGEPKQDREVVGKPARCLFWWWHSSSGARTAAKEYASPTRTINFDGGGLILAPGTDILEGDWIKEITNPEGELLIAGPFRCIAVQPYETDHIDVALMRP